MSNSKDSDEPILIERKEEETDTQALARVALSPSLQSALMCESASKTDPPADLQHERHLRKATEYRWIGKVEVNTGEGPFDVS